MGTDEGSLPKMPQLPRELQDLLRGFAEQMERDSWRDVRSREVDHMVHLLLDAMLRKFCTDVVGPVATGDYSRPRPNQFDLPIVLLWCTTHASTTCGCVRGS